MTCSRIARLGNFFAAELSREDGWRVYPGKEFRWPIGGASPRIRRHLPIMVTDIILENEAQNRRIIIDTKFTNILTKGQYGDAQRFQTGHLYQLYAYLRDLFTRLAGGHLDKDIHALMPLAYAAASHPSQ